MTEQSINAYNRRASRYEEKWRKYLEHTHQKFLEYIETGKHDVILDASGGTGLLAEELLNGSHPFKELVVNDPSVGMLAIARNRLSDQTRITFTGYRANRIPFEANRFDSILCLNSFHFYDNQQAVLDTFYRILKPGGRLHLLDWNRSGFFRIINQLLKWSAPELINTRSLDELKNMLARSRLQMNHAETWRWRYWKFLYIEAEK